MKAWELIEQSGWCQGNYAENINGADISPENENAVCFCMMGAFKRVYQDGEYARVVDKVGYFIRTQQHWNYVSNGAAIVRWNDTKGRTVGEVVGLLKSFDV